MSRILSDRYQHIVAEYATKTIYELAAQYDVTPQTIHQVLRRRGTIFRPRGRRVQENPTHPIGESVPDSTGNDGAPVSDVQGDGAMGGTPGPESAAVWESGDGPE